MPAFVSKNYLLAFDYQPPPSFTVQDHILFIHSSHQEQSATAFSRLAELYPEKNFNLVKRDGIPFPKYSFENTHIHTYLQPLLPPKFKLPKWEGEPGENRIGLAFFCVNMEIGVVKKIQRPGDQVEDVEFETIENKVQEHYGNILEYLKNNRLSAVTYIIDNRFQVFKLTRRDIESRSGTWECGGNSFFLPRTLLTFKEREELFRLAGFGPAEGAIINVGNFLGGSSIILAKGSKQNGREKVFSFDPKSYSLNEDYLDKNQVTDWVTFQQVSSENGLKDWKQREDKRIRLLFIDGDHSYGGCKKDITLWSPYLVRGGVIAVHDYGRSNHEVNFDGVVRAVYDAILSGRNYNHYRREDYLFLADKT